jgi:hypothetical protein
LSTLGAQSLRAIASLATCWSGQYGHLNAPPPLSRCRVLLLTTWPHRISIGGFPGVAASRDTGHENVEWNTGNASLPASRDSADAASGAAPAACELRSGVDRERKKEEEKRVQ